MDWIFRKSRVQTKSTKNINDYATDEYGNSFLLFATPAFVELFEETLSYNYFFFIY